MTDTLDAPRTKGPIVWMGMDQTELDNAYDQAVYAPNQPLVHARRSTATARAKARLGAPQRFHYGASEIESVDVFATKKVPTTRRSTSTSTAARGGTAARPTSRSWPKCSSMPARTADRRLQQYRRRRRQPDADGQAGAFRRRLGLQQRAEFRRRQEPALRHRPFVGRAPGGTIVTCDWQKDFGLPKDIVKGAMLGVRHVRPQAGAALQALEIRQLHRRDRAGAVRRSATSTGSIARSWSRTAP